MKPDQVSRGDILSEDDSISIKSEIELDFKQTKYYKGEISENQMCLVSLGLQIKAAKFSSINPIKLTLDKPAVCEPKETCVILKPESQSIRILGSGLIK